MSPRALVAVIMAGSFGIIFWILFLWAIGVIR